MRQVVPEWRDELIEIAERIDRWKQSGQISHGPSGTESYQNAFRSSNSVMVSVQDPDYGPCLRRFEEALIRVYHSGVLAYKQYNPFLNVTDDSGYELLRYKEGERFGLHTDAILGRFEGFRQLSGLVYLNDDYTGGETYFPRQGVKFKAKAGDLLLFPSSFCYPHESLPVTKGTKYAIVTWFVAYPKLPTESDQEDNHAEAEDDCSDTGAAADDGVRMHRSAGGGPPAGEQEAPDREHPACVGGGDGQGNEA
jgi:hypothetical protein